MPTLKPRRDKAIGLSLHLKERLKEMGFPDWVWLFNVSMSKSYLYVTLNVTHTKLSNLLSAWYSNYNYDSITYIGIKKSHDCICDVN